LLITLNFGELLFKFKKVQKIQKKSGVNSIVNSF